MRDDVRTAMRELESKISTELLAAAKRANPFGGYTRRMSRTDLLNLNLRWMYAPLEADEGWSE